MKQAENLMVVTVKDNMNCNKYRSMLYLCNFSYNN